MNGRRDRILVPAAVALASICGTVWLSSGFTRGPTDWGDAFSSKALEFLVNAGIVTVGIGYLCNAMFVFSMLVRSTCRLIDRSKLIQAFGLEMQDTENEKLSWRKKREQTQRLEEGLLDEFHLRLHSHAPQSLIDYCSRRNSAWYIANTSGIASILGWVLAAVAIFPLFPWCVDAHSCGGTVASVFVFVVAIPGALSWQGRKWNREYWGVCWKWIGWNLESHRLRREWIETLPGVRWIPNLKKSDG